MSCKWEAHYSSTVGVDFCLVCSYLHVYASMVWYGWGFTVQLDKCVLLVDKVCCQNEGKNTEMVINHVTDSCACLCLNVTYIVQM